MKHPTEDELRAPRDADPGASVAEQVAVRESCPSETTDLEDLRQALRDLPEVAPASDFWPQIEAGTNRLRMGRRWLSAAVAAIVILGAGLGAHRFLPVETTDPDAVVDVENRLVIDELVTASRELEALLARPGLRSRVMNARQAALIVDLEDRIAMVDLLLADSQDEMPNDDAVKLWSHRVRLLAALVQLRGAPGSDPNFQRAVHTKGSNT